MLQINGLYVCIECGVYLNEPKDYCKECEKINKTKKDEKWQDRSK